MNGRIIVALGMLAAVLANAQHYRLGDGTVLSAAEASVQGNQLVRVIKVPETNGVAERRHPLSLVVGLDWPEPEALVEARSLLTAGSAAAALATVEPVRRQFGPFARLPGSWWMDATRLRLQALLATGADAEAARTARELAALTTDPEVSGEAKLALTGIELRRGRPDLAAAMLDAIADGTLPAGVRARAWLLRGDLALAQGRAEEAIEAYLHIMVFFGTRDDLILAALRSSVQAYRLFGDEFQAERAGRELARRLDEAPATSQAPDEDAPAPEGITH